jgi:hypothetical protein
MKLGVQTETHGNTEEEGSIHHVLIVSRSLLQ